MIGKTLEAGWTLAEINHRLSSYTVDQLKTQLFVYARSFLNKESLWLIKHEDERIRQAATTALRLLAGKKINKTTLIEITSVPFLTPECFRRFLNYLPEDAVEILEYVVFNKSISSTKARKLFQIEPLIEGKSRSFYGRNDWIKSPSLNFFSTGRQNWYYYNQSNEIVFTLPDSMREIIAHLLYPEPLPVPFYIPNTDQENEKTIQLESIIQEELPGLLIYLRQKPLKLTKKGRPSISSVRSIGKKLKIQEFYPNTDEKLLKLIRSASLTGLLGSRKKLDTDNMVELIKSLFEREFVRIFHLPIHLLDYIIGIGRLGEYYFDNCGEGYKEIVKTMPLGKWIDYESLEKSLKAQRFAYNPIAGSNHNLTIEVPNPDSEFGYPRTIYIYDDWDEQLIRWPSFRAAMFVMASWGLIDLIYQESDVSIISETADSPYDGIKAIRLNDLGAYVLGLTNAYESKVKAPFALELADDSLSILLTDGDQDRAAMAVASFAKPLGNKRFYTDSALFLNDCKTPADLKHKINIFKSVFSEELPTNWNKFFNEISQKVNPIEEDTDFAVFRVDHDNQNLIQLIARDKELRKYCLKAEGFLILIAKKDINKFRKRLQTFGYLLE